MIGVCEWDGMWMGEVIQVFGYCEVDCAGTMTGIVREVRWGIGVM